MNDTKGFSFPKCCSHFTGSSTSESLPPRKSPWSRCTLALAPGGLLVAPRTECGRGHTALHTPNLASMEHQEVPIPSVSDTGKTQHHLLLPWAAVMMQGPSPWGGYCARKRGKDDRLKPTAGPAPRQAVLHCNCRKCTAPLLGS